MTQQEALAILKMGRNAFVTGPAGSGKTFVLNEYIKYLKDHEVEVGVTASTGIAASHIGGMTIHAWTGLGVRDNLTAYDLDDLDEKRYLWKRFEKARVLIIDEISMLHHARLDLIEFLCRKFKRSDEAFGGLQVIFCGDFFQLPPVTRGQERHFSEESDNLFEEAPKSNFAYHSSAWRKLCPVICYLEEQHRQKDPTYLKILNAIRSGSVPDTIRRSLESRYNQPALTFAKPAKLYSHNLNVDAENDRELDKLPGQTFEYGMTATGRPALADTLKRSCLAPELLRLKKGARVMFVKNNYELGFVNGTLGVVERCNHHEILVRTASGELIEVPLAGWKIDEEGKTKAEISQYPLRLAWAITVHKSQGMSLDAAEIDLSRSFEPGMGYVALSRVRSLDGLSLLGLNDMALAVNPEVLEFDRHFSEQSAGQAKGLREQGIENINKQQKDWLEEIAPLHSGDWVSGKKTKGVKIKISTVDQTKKLIEEGKSLREIIKIRALTPGTILEHGEKIKAGDPRFDFRSFIKASGMSAARELKIRLALAKGGMTAGRYELTPAKEKLGDSFSFDEIRLVRLAM